MKRDADRAVGYHALVGWLLLSCRCSSGWSLIARIPSLSSHWQPGVLAAGILGNSLSAAWNDMEVPNPLLAGGDRA